MFCIFIWTIQKSMKVVFAWVDPVNANICFLQRAVSSHVLLQHPQHVHTHNSFSDLFLFFFQNELQLIHPTKHKETFRSEAN